MADVAVRNPSTGELRMVAEGDVAQFTEQTGWHVADEQQREWGAKLLESGSVGQQALAAGETAVRTGTFGLIPGLPGHEQRAEVLREESPFISGAAQAVGAIAPALATGGLASAAAGAAGLGARGAGLAVAAAEGLAGGTAEEIEQARAETRDVSVGNILMYGLGGELVGRALPAALKMGAGKVRRALTAAEEVAGEGVPSALAAAEVRSVEAEARLAREMSAGPERAAALERTAERQYQEVAASGAESAEKLAESIGQMQGPNKRIAERIRETISESSPAQMEWSTAQKMQLDALTKKAAEAPELAAYAKRIEAVVEPALKRMDRAKGISDEFLTARDVAHQLDAVAGRLGKDASVPPTLRDELLAMVQERSTAIRQSLQDESLFGGAARIEGDLARSAERLRAAGGSLDALSTPASMRKFLSADRLERGALSGRLDEALDGAEDLLRAHEAHGTWDPKAIAAGREQIAQIRNGRALADEIQVARAGKAEREAAAAAGKGPQTLRDRAGKVAEKAASDAAEWGVEQVAELLPYGGTIYRLGKRLLGIDQAARAATKQTARRLAGTAAARAETALGVASNLAPVPAMTALARFTGDYSGPEESFAAKRKILDDELVSPGALYDAIGASLEDLPKLSPELYGKLAGRVAQKVRFVRENLPPGIQTTMMYPNGTPPSMSALRDFATLWNTTMDPYSVLEDIDAGTATGYQMQVLRQSDPDTYDQLRSDVVEEIGRNFRSIPLSTKLQMDILFDGDGLAGPLFSSRAARYIADATASAAQAGPRPRPDDVPIDAMNSHAGPGGISAIQSSVTNRGGGA